MHARKIIKGLPGNKKIKVVSTVGTKKTPNHFYAGFKHESDWKDECYLFQVRS